MFDGPTPNRLIPWKSIYQWHQARLLYMGVRDSRHLLTWGFNNFTLDRIGIDLWHGPTWQWPFLVRWKPLHQHSVFFFSKGCCRCNLCNYVIRWTKWRLTFEWFITIQYKFSLLYHLRWGSKKKMTLAQITELHIIISYTLAGMVVFLHWAS